MEKFKHYQGETLKDLNEEYWVKYFIDKINGNIESSNAKPNGITIGQPLAQLLAEDGYACTADTKLEFA